MIREVYLDSLKNNIALLKQYISRMSELEISNRIKDYWTIYEHVEHLVLSQKILLGRIKQFIEEKQPIMKPYYPDNNNIATNKNTKQLLSEYERYRKEEIELIQNATTEVWEKKGIHPEYKKYDFDILIRHILVHDGLHFWRMEELWIGKEELIKPLDTM